LDERDAAGRSAQCGVACALHRGAAGRFREHIEADGRAVAAVERLKVDDRVILITFSLRAQLEILKALPSHLCHQRGSLFRLHPDRKTDSQNPRIMLRQSQTFDKSAEVVTSHRLAGGEQPGPAAQERDVTLQTNVDVVLRALDGGFKADPITRLRRRPDVISGRAR